MGQVVLLVVAAAWAAVLLPPLLRSRLENRPNSSVLDFRNQLSSLQRAVPGRGVSVRSMGRSLAPSMLSRPAATGRPDTRNGARVNGVVSSRIAPTSPTARPARRDARMQEATLRPRQHGAADPQMAAALASSRAAEAKRRRANVLFLLVLTTVCAGFLAATTDSKAMVYLFAVSMIALGGYVYLLVTINQQQLGERAEPAVRAAPRQQRATSRRRAAADYDYDDRADEYWQAAPAGRAAPRQRPMQYPPEAYEVLPGSGESGLISYGRGAVAPTRRDPRDPYGREAYGWDSATRETTRRAPARNGRHATGQVPVQRARRPEPSGYYSQTG
jgi:hypothetical protein